MRRGAAVLVCMSLLAACQSTAGNGSSVAVLEAAVPQDDAAEQPADTEVAAAEAASADAETPEDVAATDPPDASESDTDIQTGSVGALAEGVDQAGEKTAAAPSGDTALDDAVVSIAKLHKRDGHQAALAEVFDCYRKARARDVSLAEAKICAVQDFAISRATENRFTAQGRADAKNRNLVIAKRAPERIGALMQLKGMNQSQLNAFARYLHGVALPLFEKERA